MIQTETIKFSWIKLCLALCRQLEYGKIKLLQESVVAQISFMSLRDGYGDSATSYSTQL